MAHRPTWFCPDCAASGSLVTVVGRRTRCGDCGGTLERIPETWIAQLVEAHGRTSRASSGLRPVAIGRVRQAPAGARSRSTCLQLVVTERGGSTQLPGEDVPFTVAWGDGSNRTTWSMTLGRTPGNPTRFHNKVQPTTSAPHPPGRPKTTTASLLARHGYRVGDDVDIFAGAEPRTLVIRTRRGAEVDERAAGRIKIHEDRSMQPPVLRARLTKRDLSRAAAMIRRYNSGNYLERANTDLDDEGYRRFAEWPCSDAGKLTEDLAFVGRFYGGTKESLLPEHSWTSEAGRIAEQILRDRSEWSAALDSVGPLREEIPSVWTITRLVAPFHATRNWMVWATKSLHFLRPESFPQLDVAVESVLGLTRGRYETNYYVGFMQAYRDLLDQFADQMPALRALDAETRPPHATRKPEQISDLKIVDKVLYELGRAKR